MDAGQWTTGTTAKVEMAVVAGAEGRVVGVDDFGTAAAADSTAYPGWPRY